MKVSAARADGYCAKPDPRHIAVLIYGPDPGVVIARTERVLAGLNRSGDPVQTISLSGDQVRRDPRLLVDELSSISMFGELVLVRVDSADDRIAGAVETALAMDAIDNRLVLSAGDLKGRSKLRVLCEQSDVAAAVPCYAESSENLIAYADEWLRQHGRLFAPDARAVWMDRQPADRLQCRAELEKLLLYLGDEPKVSAESVEAVLEDQGQSLMDDAIEAAALGELEVLDRRLMQLNQDGIAPQALIRSAIRHFDRLAQATIAMKTGLQASKAMDGLRPPVFFRRKNAFLAQLRLWSGPGAQPAMRRLMDAEIESKSTHVPADVAVARALMQVAIMARRARS